MAAADSASILLLDCGDVLGGKGELEGIKGKYLYESFQALGYHALNLGEADLDQGQEFLFEMIEKYDLPAISANVYNTVTGERILPPYVIHRVGGKRFLGREWGGLRIGIFGVLQLIQSDNTMLDKKEGEPRLVIKDPVIASREIVEELKTKTDFIICLAHTGWVNAKKFARSVHGVDVMIVGHGANVKPRPYLVGEIPLVMPGDQGKQVGVLDITLDQDYRVAVRDGRSKTLEETIEDDPEIAELTGRYRKELNKVGKDYVPKSSQLDVVRFLGAEACAECHEDEYEQWLTTPHADAISTLVDATQEYNPECVKCHVTGYGRFNGFHSYETTPDMVNIQCEVCHGSGIDHVNFVNGEEMGGALRSPEFSYLFEAAEDRCIACHNSEHDDSFEFDTDVKLVDHSEAETVDGQASTE